MMLQNFDYGIAYKEGKLIPVPDTMSRAPATWNETDPPTLEAARISDFDADPISYTNGDLGAVSVVEPTLVGEVETNAGSVEEQRQWFLQVHNDTEGHMGLHETLRRLKEAGYDWRRMSCDVAMWISHCAVCQKYRLGPTSQVIVTSKLASFQIFEELGVDFIGPLPKDTLGNSYICNCVCMTTHYVELFAVEAATAIIAAHCVLSVVARYGCFRRLRSDKGTHFVNEIIMEFLRLFEIQQVLTLAERPEANRLVERNGGEVMRHLRALIAPRDCRDIWSVMLPLSQRIINKTLKQVIQNAPHNLIHYAPTDLNRGILSPLADPEFVLYLCNSVTCWI